MTRKASIAKAKTKAAYVRRELADDHVREGLEVVTPAASRNSRT
ncbi:hypothetical protein [Actinomadura napierensis]